MLALIRFECPHAGEDLDGGTPVARSGGTMPLISSDSTTRLGEGLTHWAGNSFDENRYGATSTSDWRELNAGGDLEICRSQGALMICVVVGCRGRLLRLLKSSPRADGCLVRGSVILIAEAINSDVIGSKNANHGCMDWAAGLTAL